MTTVAADEVPSPAPAPVVAAGGGRADPLAAQAARAIVALVAAAAELEDDDEPADLVNLTEEILREILTRPDLCDTVLRLAMSQVAALYAFVAASEGIPLSAALERLALAGERQFR